MMSSASKLKQRRNKKAKEPSRQIKEIGDYLKPTKVIQKTMQPFAKLIGHDKSVEDVIFKPDSAHELCSVGIDRKVLFWDTRMRGQNQASQSHHQAGKD